MITRRLLLAGSASSFVLPALAQQDWRQVIKEVRFGVSSAENEAAAVARNQPVVDYLAQKLGVPVKLYRVSDYAGLVEAMRADQLEFARFGPAVYSLGRRVLGDKLQPLFRDVDNNGQEGYYSVVVVRADSPYQTLEDLVEDAKANPAQVTMSGSGKATANHLAHIKFDKMAEIQTTYVPFKGTGAAVTALLGNQVKAEWGYSTVAATQGEEVRMLAVAMEERHPLFPDVPTFKELGYEIEL